MRDGTNVVPYTPEIPLKLLISLEFVVPYDKDGLGHAPATPTKHNSNVYNWRMNSKQMKKWLEQQGATFQPGKGSHLKVFLNGKQSTLPMHGTTELGKGMEAAIKRQLGLK